MPKLLIQLLEGEGIFPQFGNILLRVDHDRVKDPVEGLCKSSTAMWRCEEYDSCNSFDDRRVFRVVLALHKGL